MSTRKIVNTRKYAERMHGSVADKLFWVDKVFEPYDTIIDIGCGDGEVMEAYLNATGDRTTKIVCVEQNEEMLELAKNKLCVYWANIQFCRSLSEYKGSFSNALVLLSSVLHEVNSYGDIDAFLSEIIECKPKYIVIRDMTIPTVTAEDELIKADENVRTAVRNQIPAQYDAFDNYLKECGREGLTTVNDLINLLLKYRYKENWEREMRENYIIPEERIIERLAEKYALYFRLHYTLPFIRHIVGAELGIDFDDAAKGRTTHTKLIFKLRS